MRAALHRFLVWITGMGDEMKTPSKPLTFEELQSLGWFREDA